MPEPVFVPRSPNPGAEQKQEQTGNLFSRIKNQLLKRRQHGRW